MSRLNINNRTIFCKDNLEILQGINSDIIDLIYLDPPFNKKKVFTAPVGSSAEGAAFSDIFKKEDVKDVWVSSIKFENIALYTFLQHSKTDGISYNYCYLVYMAIRLIECRRILKDTGSIYLHCDPTMSHYLKVVMDCIFNEKNFRNEIVWGYPPGGRAPKLAFHKKHDIILYYGKSKNGVFNNQYSPSTEKAKAKFTSVERKTGRRYKRYPGGISYLDEYKGRPVPSYWLDIHSLGQTISNECTGYPTQKPLSLLERIIKTSSKKNDIVLDPFCGCATTCVAAEKWDRQWIGIDVSHKAYELVQERLKREVPLFDLGEIVYTTAPPVRDDDGADVGDKGYVYVISNPAWQDVFKVGTARDVNKRLANYQTSSPRRDYIIEYSILASNYKEIENAVFEKYNGNRENEWVSASKNDIIDTINKMLG